MALLIGFGLAIGMVAGAWAVAFGAAAKAKSIKGMLLSVLLAVAPIVYFLLPDSVAPKPGEVSRSAGLIAAPTDGVVLAGVILVVAVAGYLIASKTGVVRSLTERLDGSYSGHGTPE